MNPIPLTLNNIVQIVVSIARAAAARPTFNEGLIVGSSAVITPADRLKRYTSVADMLTDGFTAQSPEYLAALLYFGQSPAPVYLSVGRLDLTAVQTVSIGAGGTNYVEGDILTITQQGGANATLEVTEVAAQTGAVTAVSILTRGTGYAAAAGCATTTDSEDGADCTIDIDTVGETPLQAITACRAASPNWYMGYVCGAAKADHVAIAAWIEATTPQSIYVYDTEDADALAGTAGNVFSTLKAASYNRSIGLYSTTDYAGVGLMGVAMGLNTGLANSAYILDFKTIVGVTAENLVEAAPMTENDIQTIEGNNGNVYIQRGGFYNFLEKGALASGRWFDQMINADMLAVNIQLSIMDLLYGTAKVPQTDAGVTQLVHAVNQACETAVTIGYLAPGTWMGLAAVLNLNPGDAMPKGYVVQTTPIASQSNADRSARKVPPIYVACHEAGGAQSVIIQVSVD